jgi:hypothetical protein
VSAPGDGHQQGLGAALDDGSAPGTPAEVGRDQAQATGSPERADRWCGAPEGQRLGETLGRDLARQPERAPDVLVMDEPVDQGDAPAEPGGQPGRFEVVPELGEQLVGRERGVVPNPDLVDLIGREPALGEPRGEPERAEIVEADDVGDDVADPPLAAQRDRVPLIRSQAGQQLGQVGALVVGQAHRIGAGHVGPSPVSVATSRE